MRAPLPGAYRTIRPELVLGAASGEISKAVLSLEGRAPICVERQLNRLGVEPFQTAIEKALAATKEANQVSIDFEIIDFDRRELPSGDLSFEVPSQDSARAGGTLLWRGKLYYAEGRSMPVWVRLNWWVEREVCIASRNVLIHGELLDADCQLETRRTEPFGHPVSEPFQLKGHRAEAALVEGQVLYARLVGRRPEVESGKTVDLTVVRGNAQLKLSGRAMTSARLGEPVVVANPSTGRRLEGTVVGKGAVEVNIK